jgi:AcrR family transcriptional regulator
MIDLTGSREHASDPPAEPDAPWMLDPLLVGRHPLSLELRLERRRNRLLRGALDSLAEHGYRDTTVARVTVASALSPYAFYAHFPDKEACLLLAYDLAVAWIERQAALATLALEGWPKKVRAATGSTLDLLAADRGLARLLASEILCLGPAGQARRQGLVYRLIPLLRLGRAETPGSRRSTPRLEQALVHGAIAVVDREVSAGRGGRLSELAPDLARFLLSPYLDAAQMQTGALDSAPSTAPVLR